jgi:hypothetical protein
MTRRTASLFKLGAVRRLPEPDGSWEQDKISVLGTLGTPES